MDFSQRLVLIGGTSYAGETKKGSEFHADELPRCRGRRRQSMQLAPPI